MYLDILVASLLYCATCFLPFFPVYRSTSHLHSASSCLPFSSIYIVLLAIFVHCTASCLLAFPAHRSAFYPLLHHPAYLTAHRPSSSFAQHPACNPSLRVVLLAILPCPSSCLPSFPGFRPKYPPLLHLIVFAILPPPS